MPLSNLMIPSQTMIQWINRIAYLLLLFLFLGYSALASNFAEINIQFSFLNFPIFIGEMVLGVLIILAIVKSALIKRPFKKSDFWLVIFLVFILWKAFYGYSKYGPLAFRNAALFYYFFYAVLGAFFYDATLLQSRKMKILFVILFFFFPMLEGFSSYFLLTYILLMLALVSYFKNRSLKAIFCLFLLMFFPLRQLFAIGRGALISNISAILFLVFIISFFGSFTKKKALLGFASAFLVFIFSFLFMDEVSRGRIVGLLDFKRWDEQYGYVMDEANDRLNSYRPEEFEIRIYEKNKTSAPVPILTPIAAVENPISNKESAVSIPAVKVPDKEIKNEVSVSETTTTELATAEMSNKHPVMAVSFDSLAGARVMIEAEKKVLSTPKSENFFGSLVSKFQEPRLQQLEIPSSPVPAINPDRSLKDRRDQSRASLLWRTFLWQDIFDEVKEQMIKHPVKAVFGFDFGKPIRSKRQEAVLYFLPQVTGWIEPHNFFLHLFYRAGMFSFILIYLILSMTWKMTTKIIQNKDFSGAFLLSILVFWMVYAMSLIVLELPHYAIPFWSIAGLTYRYIHRNRQEVS